MLQEPSLTGRRGYSVVYHNSRLHLVGILGSGNRPTGERGLAATPHSGYEQNSTFKLETRLDPKKYLLFVGNGQLQ